MNIVTWAKDQRTAYDTIGAYFATLNWSLVGMEGASLIDEALRYTDEVEDQIERACGNAAAIILGKFHSYKTN